jgi:trans-2,3-dihydro-3-hydroxyanthranilate isomerase
MRFDYLIVDVFSDTPFGGNQLAVLTDARGLSDEGMQAIAREFNFAESTFVLPPDDPAHAARVRIFTPARELPFAGHPTVGTACALVMSGARSPGEFVLEEGVGPVAVTTRQEGDRHSARLRLERGPDQPNSMPSPADLAAVLSLPEDAVVDAFGASVGVPFTFVQLADRDAVDRSKLDNGAWSRVLENSWSPQLYLFAGELKDGGEIYARMFAPSFGIAEDPATGAAAAAIVGAAAQKAKRSLSFDIRQGVAMGRPSLLNVSAAVEQAEVRSIEVGGGCAFVAQGEIEVPERFLHAAGLGTSERSPHD